MSCPTCGCTFQKVVDAEQCGRDVFWCSRCGTLSTCSTTHQEHEAPALVRRCRQFEKQERDLSELPWVSLGIAEAINKPEDRPR